MTLTAVQELSGGELPHLAYCSRLICGAAVRKVHGVRGPISLFEPGAVVAYELGIGSKSYGFVYRTLAREEPLACALAGVRPAVRLLISAVTARQLLRLKEFLRLADGPGQSLQKMPDALLLRAVPALLTRRPVAHIVEALRCEA